MTGILKLSGPLYAHVVYHILSLRAMGTSPQLINNNSESNDQRAFLPPKAAYVETVESLSDPETLQNTLG